MHIRKWSSALSLSKEMMMMTTISFASVCGMKVGRKRNTTGNLVFMWKGKRKEVFSFLLKPNSKHGMLDINIGNVMWDHVSGFVHVLLTVN